MKILSVFVLTFWLTATAGAFTRDDVIQQAVQLARAGESRVPASYIAKALTAPTTKLAPETLYQSLDDAAHAALRTAENAFILDPETSTLDTLPPSRAEFYRNVPWGREDYPGAEEGPHEADALKMAEELSAVRPQRRANSTDNAVIRESEFVGDAVNYVLRQLEPVPGQKEHKLNRQARASFILMRSAAKKDGVDLVIIDADRSAQTAARNATARANSYATARFSSHILGLAIDFKLSHGSFKVPEVTTRPMSTVVDMRKSPVHKWLFVRGDKFGWYPYQHEPWHWEYNPPGFRERFWAGFKGGK